MLAITALLAGCTTDEVPDEEAPTTIANPTVVARGTNPSRDTLEEYAAKCDAATGIHVRSFNCEEGTPLEGQDRDKLTGKCATPNVLYSKCDPGAKFQVLDKTADAVVVAHCRKRDPFTAATTPTGYRDIAVIQYNKVNGAVCFYQALPDPTEPSDLEGSNVRAPSEGMAAWRWDNPEGTRRGGCTGCHDNGAFIRSPYLAQLKTGDDAMPSVADGYDNKTTPLRYVGADFVGTKSWSVTKPGDTTCTTCHRLAVNNYARIGTGVDYSLIATAPFQLSKFDHGNPALDPTKSPIWMMPGQMTFSQPALDAATAISDCAKTFFNNFFLFVPGGCGIEPLGDTYSPGINASYGDDIVALGSSLEGAGVVVAFSRGDGSFAVTNTTAQYFGSLAKLPGVKRLSGDFNKDGRTDFVLVGGAGWNTIPAAMSYGDGTFLVTNAFVGADFNNWARTANVKPLVGDYNKDGYADIALTGAVGWASVPVAFSQGGGNFQITNGPSSFASFASQAGARPLVGDFNKDGFSDIALVGAANWAFIPIAFAAGGGSWQLTLQPTASFNQWASQANVTPLVGDYNRDGYSDIALTGGVWSSIPVAFSAGGGSFNIANWSIPNFGS